MRLVAVLFAFLFATQLIAQGAPGTVPIMPMTADAHPSFAVASIKPHDPNYPRRQGWGFRGDRVEIDNQSIGSMMMYAYSF